MFNVIGKTREDFSVRYNRNRMNVSTANVYFQNVRLLNTLKCKIINRDEFVEFYKGILNDIKLESSPAETIIPNEEELKEDENGEPIFPEDYQMFVTNHNVPEYQKISARVKADDMGKTFPVAHHIRMTIKEAPEKIDRLIDEIFIHWLTYKYLDMIEQVHLDTLQNFVPVVGYMIENIQEKDFKSFLNSKRINDKKVSKWVKDFAFRPDIHRVAKFYNEDHNGFPKVDVMNLLSRLVTNLVVESDIYIICACYIALSFAMLDIYDNNIENSDCAKYVRDVLSKI